MADFTDSSRHHNCFSCRYSKWGFGQERGFFCMSEQKIAKEGLDILTWNWKIPSDDYSCEFHELEFSDETRASENLKFFE